MADVNTGPTIQPELPTNGSTINWAKIASFGIGLVILFIVFWVISKGIKAGQS